MLSIARMNSNSFEVRDIHEQWQELLEPGTHCDDDFVLPCRDGCLSLDLLWPDLIFQRKAFKFPVHFELAQSRFVSKLESCEEEFHKCLTKNSKVFHCNAIGETPSYSPPFCSQIIPPRTG